MRKLFIILICVFVALAAAAWAVERYLGDRADTEAQPPIVPVGDGLAMDALASGSQSERPARPVVTSNDPPAEPPPTIEPTTEPPPAGERHVALHSDSSPLQQTPPPEDPPAPPPPTIPHGTYTLRFAAVGDLMLHGAQANHAYNAETGEYDFNPHFAAIAPYLQAADITAGNLETVFSGLAYSDYPMFSAPDEFGHALKNAGFDVLTTANNHAMDKREAGVLRTRDFLDEIGIAAVGTARNAEERDEILIIEHNNIRIAFLAYSYSTNGIPIPRYKEYLVNLLDEEIIAADLARAKALEPDFIIVMPHMGDEYKTTPSAHWRGWVKFMLDNGADIVLAHHPHVLQPTEIIETEETEDSEARFCFVAYSLGNFISGQRTIPRDEGVILNIEFTKTVGEKGEHSYISRISFVPTWVLYANTNGERDIAVLPIGEVLQKNADTTLLDTMPSAVNQILPRIRPRDFTRLNTALDNIKTQMLGEKAADIEEVQIEYVIYER